MCTKFGNNDLNISRLNPYACSVTLNSVQVCTCQLYRMFRDIILWDTVLLVLLLVLLLLLLLLTILCELRIRAFSYTWLLPVT